jgi:hypothetical protein
VKLLCAILLIASLAGGAGTYLFRDQAVAAQAQAEADAVVYQDAIARQSRVVDSLRISASAIDPSQSNAAFAKAYCAQNVDAMWAALAPEAQASFVRIYGGDGKAGLAKEATLSDCLSAKFGGSYVGNKGVRSIYIYTVAAPDGTVSTYFIITSSAGGVVDLE